MTNERLKKILENHQHYINRDCKNWENMRTNLRGADLRGADLSRADLYMTSLCWADLSGANLDRTNLDGADLDDTIKLPILPMTCPESGSFIGWKKARIVGYGLCIVKLEIPEDALRSSSTGRKCRCNKAKVLAIENMDGSPTVARWATSTFRDDFVYCIGETVTVEDFDTNRWHECAPGIHFFMSRQEAVDY